MGFRPMSGTTFSGATRNNIPRGEGRHVYVDVWHPLASSEWGYSLWSGCGEESEFGRGSVTGEHDAVAASHPVGDLIANQLRTAIDTGCFRKHC